MVSKTMSHITNQFPIINGNLRTEKNYLLEIIAKNFSYVFIHITKYNKIFFTNEITTNCINMRGVNRHIVAFVQ